MKIEDMVTFEVNGRMCVALVRKLTERECFRLMGCNDADIETIANCGVSRSAQYKMAGNSIVVDVLYHIFRTAFIPSERGDCGDLFGASNLIRGEFTKERPLRVVTHRTFRGDYCNAVTSMVVGGHADADGLANTTPYVLEVYAL